MILNTTGTKIDVTAVLDQLGISTPATINLDTITIPDKAILIPVTLIAGIVFLSMAGVKLLKGR